MTFQGLQPGTIYYVWLRAVNAYGKSGLCAASGKTSYDTASILDILNAQIGDENQGCVTQVNQKLDAAKGEISQKAARSTVTALGSISRQLRTRSLPPSRLASRQRAAASARQALVAKVCGLLA